MISFLLIYDHTPHDPLDSLTPLIIRLILFRQYFLLYVLEHFFSRKTSLSLTTWAYLFFLSFLSHVNYRWKELNKRNSMMDGNGDTEPPLNLMLAWWRRWVWWHLLFNGRRRLKKERKWYRSPVMEVLGWNTSLGPIWAQLLFAN
jgi:hypothetical protein